MTTPHDPRDRPPHLSHQSRNRPTDNSHRGRPDHYQAQINRSRDYQSSGSGSHVRFNSAGEASGSGWNGEDSYQGRAQGSGSGSRSRWDDRRHDEDRTRDTDRSGGSERYGSGPRYNDGQARGGSGLGGKSWTGNGSGHRGDRSADPTHAGNGPHRSERTDPGADRSGDQGIPKTNANANANVNGAHGREADRPNHDPARIPPSTKHKLTKSQKRKLAQHTDSPGPSPAGTPNQNAPSSSKGKKPKHHYASDATATPLSALPRPGHITSQPSESARQNSSRPSSSSQPNPSNVQSTSGQYLPAIKGTSGFGPMLGTYGRSASANGSGTGQNGGTSGRTVPKPGGFMSKRVKGLAANQARGDIPPTLAPAALGSGHRVRGVLRGRPGVSSTRGRGRGGILNNHSGPSRSEGGSNTQGASAGTNGDSSIFRFPIDFNAIQASREGDESDQEQPDDRSSSPSARLPFEYHPKVRSPSQIAREEAEALALREQEQQARVERESALRRAQQEQEGESESEEEEPIEIKPPPKAPRVIIELSDDEDDEMDAGSRIPGAEIDNGATFHDDRHSAGAGIDSTQADWPFDLTETRTVQETKTSASTSGQVSGGIAQQSSTIQLIPRQPSRTPSFTTDPASTDLNGTHPPRARSSSTSSSSSFSSHSSRSTPPRKKAKFPVMPGYQVFEAVNRLNPTPAQMAEMAREAEAKAEGDRRLEKAREKRQVAFEKKQKRRAEQAERDKEWRRKQSEREVREANERERRRKVEETWWNSAGNDVGGVLKGRGTGDVASNERIEAHPGKVDSDGKEKNGTRGHDAAGGEERSRDKSEKASGNGVHRKAGDHAGSPIPPVHSTESSSGTLAPEHDVASTSGLASCSNPPPHLLNLGPPSSKTPASEIQNVGEASRQREPSPDFATPLTPPDIKPRLPPTGRSPLASSHLPLPASDSSAIHDTSSPNPPRSALSNNRPAVPAATSQTNPLIDVKPSPAELARLTDLNTAAAISPETQQQSGVLFIRRTDLPLACRGPKGDQSTIKARSSFVNARVKDLQADGKKVVGRKWRDDGLGLEWVRQEAGVDTARQGDADGISESRTKAGTAVSSANATVPVQSVGSSTAASSSVTSPLPATRDIKPTPAELARIDEATASAPFSADYAPDGHGHIRPAPQSYAPSQAVTTQSPPCLPAEDEDELADSDEDRQYDQALAQRARGKRKAVSRTADQSTVKKTATTNGPPVAAAAMSTAATASADGNPNVAQTSGPMVSVKIEPITFPADKHAPLPHIQIASDTSGVQRTASPAVSATGSTPGPVDAARLAELKAACAEAARRLEEHYENEEEGAYTAPRIGKRLLDDLTKASEMYKLALRGRTREAT